MLALTVFNVLVTLVDAAVNACVDSLVDEEMPLESYPRGTVFWYNVLRMTCPFLYLVQQLLISYIIYIIGNNKKNERYQR